MITWLDFTVAQERHKDLLLKREQARLIKQVKAESNKRGRWQNISRSVFRNNQKSQLAPDQAPDGIRNYLAGQEV